MRMIAGLLFIVLVLAPIQMTSAAANIQPEPVSGSLAVLIQHSNMTIDVRLVGFSNNTVKLASLVARLQRSYSPMLQLSSRDYGSSFSLGYSVNFTSETVSQSLRILTQSSVAVEQAPDYLQQFFGSRDNSVYAVIPTARIEEWLSSNQALGAVESHYLVVVANLTGISNHDHFYEKVDVERDSSSQSARYNMLFHSPLYFPAISWLLSWGVGRAYFIDVSAGSKARDYTLRTNPHVPMQDYFPQYRPATNDTVAEYVADYVSEAVRNLITQNYSRFPPFSDKYHVKLFFFDDTGRMLESNYEQFFNASLIRGELHELIPYANFTVESQFATLDSDTGLKAQVKSSLISEGMKVGFGQTGLVVRRYDAWQLYTYVKSHLDTYAGESEGVVIPIFCLSLRSAGRLVNVYQENVIQKGLQDPDGEPRGAAVLPFPELGLISLSERDVFDWGVGFTHSIIQSAGQMMGLQEKSGDGFSFADALSSVMSQQTYGYEFSQFDKDALQRAHADYVLSLDEEQTTEVGALTLQGAKDIRSQTLLGNVTQIVNQGKENYGNSKFQSATEAFKEAYDLLDMLFTSHAEWVKEALDTLGVGTTETGRKSISAARANLVDALSARSKGDLANSFRFLTQASINAAIGMNVEEIYKDTYRSNIILGILIGMLIGGPLAVLAYWLERRTIGHRKQDEHRAKDTVS